MSFICQSQTAVEDVCQHTAIEIGKRGANCKQCGCFLYSQVGNYHQRNSVVATINSPEDRGWNEILPFEYYEGLIQDEAKDHLVDVTKLDPKILTVRKKMIDYIIELGDRFKQRNLTIHTAIVYLDLALEKFSEVLLPRIENPEDENTNKDHSNLWAIVCLMLASKYDEIDKRIPFYKEIIKASTRAAIYTKEQFLDVEEFIVKKVLNWNFCVLTTLHFSYNLVSQGILFEDDTYQGTQEKILKSLRK